jgi:hypothetical protein
MAGAAFRFAMISIGSGLKPRASQRCRNNCLTLEMEDGPRQIFWVSRDPWPAARAAAGKASNNNGNQQTAGASKPPPSPSVTNVAGFRATEIPLKHGAAIVLRRSGGQAGLRD